MQSACLGDIWLDFWERNSTVAINPDLYPKCVYESIESFDPERASQYKPFGKDIHGPDKIGSLYIPIYIGLTKQNNLEVSVAARVTPRKEQEDAVENFISQAIKELSFKCNGH